MMEDKRVTSKSGNSLNDLETTARRLAVSVWTVRRWVQTGRLASVKLGTRRLIAESEIERTIAEGLRDDNASLSDKQFFHTVS